MLSIIAAPVLFSHMTSRLAYQLLAIMTCEMERQLNSRITNPFASSASDRNAQRGM